jgi:hypothetical protein
MDRHVSALSGPSTGAFTSCMLQIWYVEIGVLLDNSYYAQNRTLWQCYGANTYVLKGLPQLKLEETVVEDLNCHFGPPDLTHTKLWCCSSQNRELRRFRPLVWNMSANCKGRHEHAADLPEVRALVGCQRAEAEETKNMDVARTLFTHLV